MAAAAKSARRRATPAPAARPECPKKATGEGKETKPNKPLGFALTLDPEHPYLAERGIPPELIATFGLGYCEQGIMAGASGRGHLGP
jgi:hypothetical protein